MRRVVIGGFAALALAFTGACGDNGEIENTADGSGSAQEYCAMSAELDAADAPPTDEQLDEIVEVAPAEIKDDVRTLADAIREEDFEAEAAQEADQNLQAWEAQNCAGPGGGTDPNTGNDTDPNIGNDDPGTENPAGIQEEEDNGTGTTRTDEGPAGGDEGTDTTG